MREPLVHFLVLGALIFGVYQWRGSGGPDPRRIVITSSQVDSIIAAFVRTWQRQPTEQELKEQLDERLREEIAAREATAMGLDRDDAVILRRLRQKFEFLTEDTVDLAPPTDADLQAWLDANPDAFRTEPQMAFRQVYLSPERRGASLEKDTEALRAKLAAARPDVNLDTWGDRLTLPNDVARSPRSEIARLFGDGFADEVLKVTPRRWAGPIRSGYGMHLVFVTERDDGHLPALAEVRTQVERELTVDRRRKRLDEVYRKLLEGYTVVIEKRSGR
jgi:hypothetical protein